MVKVCHPKSSLWLSNWMTWCGECGTVTQHHSEIIHGRLHKKGDMVDEMGSGAVPDHSMGEPGSVSDTKALPSHTVVYLAHGYTDQTKEIGLRVMKRLEEHGIEVINPFIRGEQAKYDKYLSSGMDLPDDCCAEIVAMDLEKIDRSHGIVSVPRADSIGTYMELFYGSYIQGKPCFVNWIHNAKRHPWLQHLTHLYINNEDAMVTDTFAWSDGRR